MKPSEAAQILRTVLQEYLPPGEPVFEVLQEHVYHLSVAGCSYLIKWIADEDASGQNELRIGRLLSQRSGVPAPRLLFDKVVRGGRIAGWEYLSGHDLRSRGREQLPEAFAELGRLHLALRNDNPVVSPLSSDTYSNISEMLAAVTYRLTAPFPEALRQRCAALMRRLEFGYPTLIHGDVHPGNLFLSGGRVWFVDWSFACNSLNLLDLDYIESIALPGSPAAQSWWPVIRPDEATGALKAYFQAAGLDYLDISRTHQAVMVWNLLRKIENGVKNGYRAEVETNREQLAYLLNLEPGG